MIRVEPKSYLFNLVSFIKKVIHIDNGDIEAFALKASLQKFCKKELFIREGEVCNQLLFIHKGAFRYFILHEGNDLTKDFAIDNQNPFCTSFTSFITQKPSQIWIEALEDSIVWTWEEAYVSQLFQSHPGWTLFAKKMSESLYVRKEKRELDFLKLSSEERYQQFLIDFPQFHQRIPQYLIASYLGLTPESLSRMRARIFG
jgi:CRP-like cAMP-binding protein